MLFVLGEYDMIVDFFEHVYDIFSDEFLIGLTLPSPVDNCKYFPKKTTVFHHPNELAKVCPSAARKNTLRLFFNR